MGTPVLRISSVPSPTASLSTPVNRDSRFQLRGRKLVCKLSAIFSHDISCSNQVRSNSVADVHKKSSLGSLFCYDKPIPEEIIEKPIGLSLAERNIGENPRCPDCEAKGATLCSTCSGSGLYVDSILESQGIIVKVRCLGNHLTSRKVVEAQVILCVQNVGVEVILELDEYVLPF